MDLILTIARKELREMVRDRRFRWCAGVCLVLLFAALVTGVVHQRRYAAERDLAERLDRQTWVDQGEKDPHTAAHYGVYASRPSSPLAFADRGIDAYAGQAVWLEAHAQNLAHDRPAEDRTALQRFGELTAAAVLQLLLPLLIVFLAADALVGERERGTLRQLASLGVPPGRLALGKALGVALALALVLVPAAVLGGAALMLVRGDGAASDLAARMALMMFAYVLYLAAFVAVTLAVSARAPSSRTALVVLLAFWIGNGLMLPRVFADLSERIQPTPSASAFWAPLREQLATGLASHNPNDPEALKLKAQVLSQYGVERVEDLPINYAGIKLQAGEDSGNQVFDREFGRLWGAYERQADLQLLGAIAAPLLAVRSASMGLAGTDVHHHVHFATAAEEHRRALQRFLNADLSRNRDSSYVAGRSVWEQAPAFTYSAPRLAGVARRQLLPFALLAAWLLIAVAAAARSASQMKVV